VEITSLLGMGLDFMAAKQPTARFLIGTVFLLLIKTLPFGTVINANGVQVRVNDRGPFAGARVFDFSEAAAKRIRTTSGDTLYQAGVGYVNICF
jgi:hypothetical protein